jgi:transmembrane sensor
MPRWLHLAAVVALLVSAGLAGWLRPITRPAPPGGTLVTVLPDGSRIELNSGASLSYQRSFGWTTRTVRLAGEAYFDVSSAETPFVVHTFNARVTVRGTRFNVRAWRDDPVPATTVVLEEGSVEVAAQAAPEKTVVLAPGQMSQVESSAPAPSVPAPVDVLRALAWRTGGLAFADQPLAVILTELERRFGVDLHTRSERLRTERFSLFVSRADSLETLLGMICASLECRYQATAQGFELTDAE